MSKKKTSETESSSRRNDQYQFDPTALSTYQGLQPQIGKTLGDFMAHPWESGYFQKALTRASEGTGQRANVLRSNLLNPALMAQGSVSNPNAFLLSQNNAIGRGASRERSDALTNLLMGSANLRMQAAQQAAGYQPLQTGATSEASGKSKTTEKTGGGWASLIAPIAGIAAAPFTGGASLSLLGMQNAPGFTGFTNPFKSLAAPPYMGLGSPSFGNMLNNLPPNSQFGPYY